MRKTVLICNLSAITHPPSSGLHAQLPSLTAFYKLHNQFLRFGFFTTKIMNIFLFAKNFLSCGVIEKYKKGELTTDEFLTSLLEKEFYFLEKLPFEQNPGVIEAIKKYHAQLLSLSSEKVDPNSLDKKTIAKALLEIAWIARMQFDVEADKKIKMFLENPADELVLISNTNPMDVWQTILHFKKTYPEIKWRDNNDLRAQITAAKDNQPIILTTENTNKKICLYTSYKFNMNKTDGLIEKIKNDYPNCTLSLVSQWEGDRKKAEELGIERVEAPHILLAFQDAKFS